MFGKKWGTNFAFIASQILYAIFVNPTIDDSVIYEGVSIRSSIDESMTNFFSEKKYSNFKWRNKGGLHLGHPERPQDPRG
jgi:hypothetical protein